MSTGQRVRIALAAIGLVGLVLSFSTAAQPADYPAHYQQIIDASRQERSLLVYSNMAAYNWQPVIEAFNRHYPWITVQTLDLGSGEVFERYYSEVGSGARTADLMISGSPEQWIEFVSNRREAVEYVSPELANYPQELASPLPGLYTVSLDPMVLAYNKLLLAENLRPTGLQHLADLGEQEPGVFRGKITTYDVTEAFGYAINWAFVRDRGGEEAWAILSRLLPNVRPERSAGPMLEKITIGEYVAGYFISGIVLFPRLERSGQILGWTYMDEGTPFFMRGMAIPKHSTNVNSAKLMLDFILSKEGQEAFGRGGLTPYRADVDAGEFNTYRSILERIGGESKAIIVGYDEESLRQLDDFQARWESLLGR
ncbi:ABC transporter substrate-binding protein [Limnochorda pilosa]|uniref:ABC transporter substrate-binding protein n=1 Tax=Limnochorda pilosa TaxID=1555112 RepID=UPI001E5826A4|nr:extracellular solute-binding protein [Limnochorda pilosa]